MPQPTIGFIDPTKRKLLGVPQDRQWCEVTLRKSREEDRTGIARYEAIGAFADVRVDGIDDRNIDKWELVRWKPTSPPDIDP